MVHWGRNAYPNAWVKTELSVRDLKMDHQNAVNDGIRSITSRHARAGNV